MEALKQCYYKIEDFITAVCKVVGGLSVFIFVMVIFLQVVLRNAFKMPIIWANDVAVISFVWATFIGSACAVRKRSHYTVELIPAKFAKTNKILDLIGDISGFIFFYVLIRYGIHYAQLGLRRMSTSMNIPMAYFFACIPVSAVFMMIFNADVFMTDVNALIRLCKGGKSE